MTWRPSRAAEEDLIEIWLYGAEHHGPTQADRDQDSLEGAFARLAQFPELARERSELTPPLLMLHNIPYGIHERHKGARYPNCNSCYKPVGYLT